MPCALPPVDLSVARIGWHQGTFFPPRGEGPPVSHPGVDFMADEGSPVVAAFDGVVVHVGRQPYGSPGTRPGLDALGHYVVVEWARGESFSGRPDWTRYSHLRSASSLRVGQAVRAGDLIGYVGTSGMAPGRRRPRLFFEVVAGNRPDDPTPDYAHGVPLNAMEFLTERGLQLVDQQSPGPDLEGFEQVPAWGGTLVQVGACAPRGVGTARSSGSRQDPRYARYGSTQLSRTDPYPPANYDEHSVDTSLRSVVLFWTCWLAGTAAGLYALHRFVLRPRGLSGLGACPCDTNPTGRECLRLAKRAIARGR